MAFTKHTTAEKVEVVSEEEHNRISAALRREGKVKLSDVDPEKRPEMTFPPDIK